MLADDACASWILDGGVLHAYDVVGDAVALAPVIERLNGVGRERFAAVMTVTAYDGDPASEALISIGFERDWEESDVRGGRSVRLVGLVREVQ